MARGTWVIYVENSSGGWDEDGTINIPNQDLETSRISTTQKIRLANGANAFVTPSTKMLKEPISMFWADTTSAFRTKIETYMDNGDKVKIVADSENLIGRFISMSRVWFCGIEDSFDVNVVLEQTS